MKSALIFTSLVLAPLMWFGCSDEPEPTMSNNDLVMIDLSDAPDLIVEGQSKLVIALPKDAPTGLKLAADDLSQAIEKMTKVTPGAKIVTWDDATPMEGAVIRLVSGEVAQGQGYTITRKAFWDQKAEGLQIEGESSTGTMYGVYDLIAQLGVRYHHPEETFFPTVDPSTLVLPWETFPLEASAPNAPRFTLRGFHEHTQHPIPMSDYYLRPEPEFRPYVSRYLRWMARNRQNAASWHMLKSVELEPWKPYVKDIIEEAHGLGIRVGMVTSFVDEQQNNFKIILVDKKDAQGALVPDETQIKDVLTDLHSLGFDFLTFQIGSSEFTKPKDSDVLRWLEVAANTSKGLEPKLSLFTWIHTTCSLKTETGDYFYHLPGQSPPEIGAWVHTVMFHTLEHPAPVYDCETFNQQRDFMLDQQGKREQVYFPESAWWLGFDNNMPLALPLTGWTRAWDIQKELKGKDVSGHITFTTGREWNYWQYDHYLMQATWDDSIGWEDYLTWISPMYGADGEKIAKVLHDWTLLQKKHVLEDNPEIYFYLAGELEQDEIGEKAGIVARRPKISFQQIVDYEDAEFNTWKARDYDMLLTIREEYAMLLATLDRPTTPMSTSSLEEKLKFEVWAGLYLHVKRLDHAILLYTGAIDTRTWVKFYRGGGSFEDPQRQMLKMKAQASFDEAQKISKEAEALILEQEVSYRYSAEILTQPKPQTLTTYPIGYLEQTHSAFFWHRRDEQLGRLIEDGFAEDLETWAGGPDVLFSARGKRIKMTKPDSVIASSVIGSFIPQLLFGLKGSLDDGTVGTKLLFAQDYNVNFKPDEGTESALELTIESGVGTALIKEYVFIARTNTGALLGEGLKLRDGTFTLTFEKNDKGASQLVKALLDGEANTTELVAVLRAAAPDGIDEESAINLIKDTFKLPKDEPLPETVEIQFTITTSPAVIP